VQLSGVLWLTACHCHVAVQGCFPEPDKDPVIQIASMVTNQGESSPVVRNVMTLDTCAAIIGSEVMSFKTEQELLTVIILLPPLHVCFRWDFIKPSVS